MATFAGDGVLAGCTETEDSEWQVLQIGFQAGLELKGIFLHCTQVLSIAFKKYGDECRGDSTCVNEAGNGIYHSRPVKDLYGGDLDNKVTCS